MATPTPDNDPQATADANKAAVDSDTAADTQGGKITGFGNSTPASLGLTYTADPTLAGETTAAKSTAQAGGYLDSSGNVQAPPDENTVRTNTLNQFQTQIDAINSAKAEAATRIANNLRPGQQNRTGSTIATAGRRGLLGSDFGTADIANVNRANEDETAAAVAESDAKYETQVQGLLGKAADLSASNYKDKRDAFTKSANDYVTFLRNRTTSAQTAANQLAQEALTRGIDLSDPKNKNVVEQLVHQGTLPDGSAFLTPTMLVNGYTAAREAKAKADAAASVVVPAGGSVINKSTGTTTAEGAPKPQVLNPGQTLVDTKTGKPIASGQPKITSVGTHGSIAYDPATNSFIRPAGGGSGGSGGGPVGTYKPDPAITDPTKPDPAIGGLTHNSLDFLAKNYLNTGAMPSMGLGQAADVKAARFAVLNRAADIANGSDPSVQRALVKADGETLKTLTVQQGVITKSEDIVKKQLTLLEGLLSKVTDVKSPFFNKLVRDFQNDFLGDPDTQPFVNAMLTTSAEYAKVVSGGTGNAQLHQSAAEDAKKRISTAITQGQFKTTAATMQQEMANTSAGYADQIKAIQERMAHYNSSAPVGATGGYSVQAPNGKTYNFPTQDALNQFKSKANIP